MTETKSYRKYFSIFLIIVFFSPLLIKATHFLFVHHERHHISFSDKPKVNEKHKNCPICAFEFVEFIDNENPQYTVKPEFFLDYDTSYSQSEHIVFPSYSFNLRAPPANS